VSFQITVTDNISQISISDQPLIISEEVAGVQGAQGAQGSSGVVSVTSPITNSGTSSSAQLGFDATGFVKTAISNTWSTGAQLIRTGADAVKGLILQRNSASQSANLLSVVQSDGTTEIARIRPGGQVGVGSLITNTTLGLDQTVTGDNRFIVMKAGVTTPTNNAIELLPQANNTPIFKVDASGNVTAPLFTGSGAGLTNIPDNALTNIGTAGTYTKVTTDSKGRVTSGTTLSASDVPNITEAQVTNLETDLAAKLSLTNYQNQMGQSATILETVPRINLNAASPNATPSGRIAFSYFTPSQNLTISQITIANTTGGTDTGGTTVRRLGLYTVSGTTHTLVARTDSDATIGNAANSTFTRSLSTTGGYPSTYSLVAGTRYALAVIFYNTGGTFASPTVVGQGNGVGVLPALSPVLSSFLNGQSDLVTSTSGVTNGNGYIIYGRLS